MFRLKIKNNKSSFVHGLHDHLYRKSEKNLQQILLELVSDYRRTGKDNVNIQVIQVSHLSINEQQTSEMWNSTISFILEPPKWNS